MFEICVVSSCLLLVFSISLMFLRLKFIVARKVVFVEWELFCVNGSDVVITFLFD